DLAELLALVHAHDIAAMGTPGFSADGVRDVLHGPHHDASYDSWVVVDPAGDFAAWAYVDNRYGYPPDALARERVDVIVHPDAAPGMHVPLLAITVDRVAQRARAAGRHQVQVHTGHLHGQKELRSAITAAGFGFERRYARMRRDLTGEEPPPPAPPGTLVRAVDPKRDARTMHRVIDSAFAELPEHTSVDFDAWWGSVDAATPWDECLLAEVAGEAVATLQSTAQEGSDGGGWIRNLAVLPSHRGRGLARLLLATGFARYAANGRTWAGLGVNTGNPTGAFALYESVGLRVTHQADFYSQTLSL
ncbi:MAG: GNAT family N-acetyltransferase, partial [Micromonosporaceae bacterium]